MATRLASVENCIVIAGHFQSLAQGAVNNTDWIRADKDGTFDALVGQVRT